jgi:hypothetical protein
VVDDVDWMASEDARYQGLGVKTVDDRREMMNNYATRKSLSEYFQARMNYLRSLHRGAIMISFKYNEWAMGLPGSK